jgi:predicted DNA binding CopG/RHH family protein
MSKKTKSNSKEERERSKYLSTDFGEILEKLEPLDLSLEFPSPTQSISLRLPREVLNKIRIMADEQDIPYQSLIKLWLAEKVKKAS